MKKLQVEIWSDFVCPFCYLGKKRLENVSQELGIELDVIWYSFELAPDAPEIFGMTNAERLKNKYGFSDREVEAFMRRITSIATEENIPSAIEKAQSGNTFNLHKLLKLAEVRGCSEQARELVFQAYLCEGRAVGTLEELAKLVRELGLSEEDLQEILTSKNLAQQVRNEQQRAREVGVNQVPYFIFNKQVHLSGVPPREQFALSLKAAM